MGPWRTQLEAALKQNPAHTALMDLKGQSCTFGQLDHWSAAIRDAIPAFAPGARMAVCLPKTIGSVASIFGIIRCGGAYVPVDYDAPGSRSLYILRDARVELLITTPERAKEWMDELDADQCLQVDAGDASLAVLQLSWRGLSPVEAPSDLAYILYTSGSTGFPKGVMITEDNAWCFIDWAARTFSLSGQDVVSSLAPFHFDLSVFDLYAGLFCGATVVLIDAAEARNPLLLAEVIDRFGVTVWYATPTTLKMMLRFGRMERYAHDTLRVVLFAGEVFPTEPLHALMTRWPQAGFHNLYGPTETNVCTWYSLPKLPEPGRTAPYPIGSPCPYATCYLLSEEGIYPALPGREGELLVGGRSVMAGYLQQPERNAGAFTWHHGEKCYHTGDIVKVDERGDLIYISRKDRMVKRHGYRIELGEVEAALHRHPDITEAGVIAVAGPAGEWRIHAFYSTRTGEPLGAMALQDFLGQHLPAYMLPDQTELMGELPKTSTHKIDYPALQRTP